MTKFISLISNFYNFGGFLSNVIMLMSFLCMILISSLSFIFKKILSGVSRIKFPSIISLFF